MSNVKWAGIVLIFQMGWWGEMGGPKQKGVVQYSMSSHGSYLNPQKLAGMESKTRIERGHD